MWLARIPGAWMHHEEEQGVEWLLFLVLMMGVGLGSVAAAWALRPSEEERMALVWYRDWATLSRPDAMDPDSPLGM